jgi:Skp family chaperone for outer membrane proteins
MEFASTLCTLLLSTTLAQTSPQEPPTRIAVVNLTAVFERYQMTHDLEQVFDQRTQQFTAQAGQRRDNINLLKDAIADFKRDSAEFAQREEEFIKAQIEFQAWLEIHERRLKQQHTIWLKLIYENTRRVVAKLASERNIDLVLTINDIEDQTPDSASFKQQILLRSVIFASPRTDLTEQTIERLDHDYQARGGAQQLVPNNNAPQTGG